MCVCVCVCACGDVDSFTMITCSIHTKIQIWKSVKTSQSYSKTNQSSCEINDTYIIMIQEENNCYHTHSIVTENNCLKCDTTHAMQTQSSDENSVRLSVRFSVKDVNCDKTGENLSRFLHHAKDHLA